MESRRELFFTEEELEMDNILSQSYIRPLPWIDFNEVSEEYLEYKPEDIAVMNNKHMLEQLLDSYSPSAQPWNEHDCRYLTLMMFAIITRLAEL